MAARNYIKISLFFVRQMNEVHNNYFFLHHDWMNCLLYGRAFKPLRKLSIWKENTEVVKIQLVRLINANYL